MPAATEFDLPFRHLFFQLSENARAQFGEDSVQPASVGCSRFLADDVLVLLEQFRQVRCVSHVLDRFRRTAAIAQKEKCEGADRFAAAAVPQRRRLMLKAL